MNLDPNHDPVTEKNFRGPNYDPVPDYAVCGYCGNAKGVARWGSGEFGWIFICMEHLDKMLKVWDAIIK